MKSRLTTTLAAAAAVFFLTTTLVGCSNGAEHSVDWYVKHPKARKAKGKECGMMTEIKMEKYPDCRNVHKAFMLIAG